jgi:hypothetical protein
MPVRWTAFLLTAFIILHIFLLQRAAMESKMLPAVPESGIVLPTPVLTITSLEFKGLVSDLLFIKALVFKGSTYERKKEPRLKPEEWQWLNRVLMASTDLDPYFFDPYFLANAHMTWEAGMVRETNELLEKGTQYRDWDWLLPFFAGFNNFFFLHDNAKAAELLTTASQRPGPSEQLLSLAARLAFKEKKTENAILFLEAITKKTDDERQKKEYETRIRALRTRLFLERSVTAYKARFGRPPVSLQKLVVTGIVEEIPQDPYGGKFFIGPAGEITCTSDYLLIPYQRQR